MFAEKSLMATNLQNNNPKATSIFTHNKAYVKKSYLSLTFIKRYALNPLSISRIYYI